MKQIFKFAMIAVLFLGTSVSALGLFHAASAAAFEPIVVMDEYDSIPDAENGGWTPEVPQKGSVSASSFSVPARASFWYNTTATSVSFQRVDRANFALEMWLYVDRPIYASDTPINFRFDDTTAAFSTTAYYEAWLNDFSDLEQGKWNRVRIKYTNGGGIGTETLQCNTFAFKIYNYAFSDLYIHDVRIVYDDTQTELLKSYGTDDLITVQLSETTLNFSIDGENSRLLTASVEGDDSFEPVYRWFSSDESVAIVSDDGLVTKRGVGHARIGCETEYEGLAYSSYCDVYVRDPAAAFPIELFADPSKISKLSEISDKPVLSETENSYSLALNTVWNAGLVKNIDLYPLKGEDMVLSMWLYVDGKQDNGAFNFLFTDTEKNVPDFVLNDHDEAWIQAEDVSKLAVGQWNHILINYDSPKARRNSGENVDFYSLNIFQNAFERFYINDLKFISGAPVDGDAILTVLETVPSMQFSLSQERLTLEAGQDAQLFPELVVSGGADAAFSWGTSDPAVATVSEGKVHAAAAGSCTVYAEVVVMGQTVRAECSVTVGEAAQGIQLSQKEIHAALSDNILYLSASLTGNVADGRVEWSSSDSSIASVDQKGMVSIFKSGTVTITARSFADPDVYAVCMIHIEDDTGSGCAGSALGQAAVAAAGLPITAAAAAAFVLRRTKE